MRKTGNFNYIHGVALGLLSSAAFGLIPLFTIPMYGAGVSIETALIYRFCLATLAMAPILVIKGEKFRIPFEDVLKLALLSGFYMFAVVAYFHSFKYLPSSIACTLQFLYPLMVMLIMIAFFHEKFSWAISLAVALGVAGVAILTAGTGPEAGELLDGAKMQTARSAALWGVVLSLLSGLGNSLYMAGIQVAKLSRASGLVMTFYVMLFGSFYALIYSLFGGSLQWLANWRDFGLALSLALVTAVLSNLTLIISIQKVGSTLASILGVLEPLTAVAVGILVFHEPFTSILAIGVLLIMASVLVAILAPKRNA